MLHVFKRWKNDLIHTLLQSFLYRLSHNKKFAGMTGILLEKTTGSYQDVTGSSKMCLT